MIEETVVRMAAPTLAGIKTGSLFLCPFGDHRSLLKELCRLNRLLVPRGLSLLPLREGEGKVLLYLYRPSELEKDLRDDTARDLLCRAGYPCEGVRLGQRPGGI